MPGFIERAKFLATYFLRRETTDFTHIIYILYVAWVYCPFQKRKMHSLLGLLAAATTAIGVMAKPEQIRGVTSPIFHYYLQGYPQDRESMSPFLLLKRPQT